jgi:uncharacterized membrane protein
MGLRTNKKKGDRVGHDVADGRGYRLSSIDMLRGLAIVIMAIDHCRDFFMLAGVQDPMRDPNITLTVFFTRWITHFCAPIFVLLAGTSAGLMASRKDAAAMGRFLLVRGLWLIVVECFVISTAFTFAPGGIGELGGRVLVVMQVIWAIGASMVFLAGAQFLGRKACLAIGAAIVVGHNLLDPVWPVTGMMDMQWPLWVALHSGMSVVLGPFHLLFAYPLLPWIGVMLLGYGGSSVFEQPADRRNAALLKIGVGLCVTFVGLRALDVYGDPHAFRPHAEGFGASLMAFLNTTKYPPSLLFLLMTLGPGAIVCSFADRMQGVVKDGLVMFGRVPFAFYVAHFYLIHALSVLLGLYQGFRLHDMLTIFLFYPKGYGVPLPTVYAAWLVVLALLYPFCRWVAGVKARRRDWWLSYL